MAEGEIKIIDGAVVVRALALTFEVLSKGSPDARLKKIEDKLSLLAANIQGFEENMDTESKDAPDPFEYARMVQDKLDAMERQLQEEREAAAKEAARKAAAERKAAAKEAARKKARAIGLTKKMSQSDLSVEPEPAPEPEPEPEEEEPEPEPEPEPELTNKQKKALRRQEVQAKWRRAIKMVRASNILVRSQY